MKGFFNRKSPAPPAELTTEQAAALARRDGNYSTKQADAQRLLQRAVAGDTAPFFAFLQSYLVYKRELGNYEKSHSDGLDSGYTHLLCRPALSYIEQMRDAKEALAQMTAQYSPFYRQMLCDILLREAASNGSWAAVEVLLASGADPNCGQGRPLNSAVREGHPRIVQMLLAAGADTDLTLLCLKDDDDKAEDFLEKLERLRSVPAKTTAALERPAEAPRLRLSQPKGPDV